MVNKCNDMHKYGPFKKNNEYYYRVCLRCNKRVQYPVCEEINIEYDKQNVVNYIVNILVKKDLSVIQNSNYFFRLVACLFDDISYVYLTDDELVKLLESIIEFNNYFNLDKDIDRYKLIDEAVNYCKDYFYNFNEEVKNKYSDDLLDKLDNNHIIINRKLELELENIILGEENIVVTVDDDINIVDSDNNIELEELQNEMD